VTVPKHAAKLVAYIVVIDTPKAIPGVDGDGVIDIVLVGVILIVGVTVGVIDGV
jgi:hypothetical protein